MESVIKTENLTKYYGKVKGIENLNLSVRKGEIYGFLGPNGAGKTTSIRLLLHLILPSSGKIRLFDMNLAKHYKNLFRRIGNVPGEFKLYEEVTGAYFLNYLNAFSREAPKLRTELLEEFRLTDEDLHKKIRHYSRGMKQKLLLIQALQEEPDLLILDEPSAGLDPLNKKVLYDYLQRFKKSGRTVFFSSHNLAEVDKICDRAGIVRDGNLIAEETLSELKKKMIRRLYVKFADTTDFMNPNLLNAKMVEQRANQVEFMVSGDINELIQKISQFEIQDLIFPEASLEDTFLYYYQDENHNAAEAANKKKRSTD